MDDTEGSSAANEQTNNLLSAVVQQGAYGTSDKRAT